MPRKSIETLQVRSRKEWRSWLQEHHDSVAEIWLVFPKRHTGQEPLSYDDAVEEALCFGWIDSLVRRLDEDRFARKFTPRKPDSRWSSINRRRYADLEQRGLLAPPGRERPPTDHSSVAPARRDWGFPAYIETAFRANPRAWANFEKLAPSHRRSYIGWIDSAKREETKQRRLDEAVRLLAAGEKLGLK